MKNLIRTFAVILALTGAAATATRPALSSRVETPKPGSYPIPMCPPDDPDACGIRP